MNECLLVGKCAMLNYAMCNDCPAACVILSTGMYYESAGREVQAAGSSGGSHAKGAEVSPTTEGRRHLTTAKPMIQSFLHSSIQQREDK